MPQPYLLLAQALLAPVVVSVAALTEAEDVLSRVRPLVEEAGDSDLARMLEQLEMLRQRESGHSNVDTDDLGAMLNRLRDLLDT
jgi:hypothetical protein